MLNAKELSPEKKKNLIFQQYAGDFTCYGSYGQYFDERGRVRWATEQDDLGVVDNLLDVLLETLRTGDGLYRDRMSVFFDEEFEKSSAELATALRDTKSGSQNITTQEHLERVDYTLQTNFLRLIILKAFPKKDPEERMILLRAWRKKLRTVTALHDLAKKFIHQEDELTKKLIVIDDFTQDHAFLSALIAKQLLQDTLDGRGGEIYFQEEEREAVAFAIRYHHLWEHIDKGTFTREQAVEILKNNFRTDRVTSEDLRKMEPDDEDSSVTIDQLRETFEQTEVPVVEFILLAILSTVDVLSVKGYERFAAKNISEIIYLLPYLFDLPTQAAIAHILFEMMVTLAHYVQENPDHYIVGTPEQLEKIQTKPGEQAEELTTPHQIHLVMDRISAQYKQTNMQPETLAALRSIMEGIDE